MIIGVELDWIIDYLQENTQKVKLNNIVSEELSCGMGVSQGSVLGSLLFLIYVDDIVNYVGQLYRSVC